MEVAIEPGVLVAGAVGVGALDGEATGVIVGVAVDVAVAMVVAVLVGARVGLDGGVAVFVGVAHGAMTLPTMIWAAATSVLPSDAMEYVYVPGLSKSVWEKSAPGLRVG